MNTNYEKYVMVHSLFDEPITFKITKQDNEYFLFMENQETWNIIGRYMSIKSVFAKISRIC